MVKWTDVTILRAALRPRYVSVVERAPRTPLGDDGPPMTRLVGGACCELLTTPTPRTSRDCYSVS